MSEDRRYSDFDLLIEARGDEGYRARVVDSPAGQAAGSFELPFSEIQLENFLLKVGRPRRGVRRLESPEMEAARDFGTQLFEAVFRDDLKLSLRRSLDEVERRDEGLRIRLWFSDAPELASLPWEFLFSETDDQFLVLSAWTPIVRYLDLTQPVEPLTVTGPLRILAMISSPHDYPELDVEDEWRRIENALQPLVERGAVVIDRTDNATLLEVQRLLRKNEYHIFHFVGHGGFDEKANDGVLVLEDGNNRSRLVAGRDVGTILNDHRSLRLAVLNACEGARAAEEDPFSGAAQSLVRKGIPGVVAMQFEITDDAAIAFAQEFYGAIADGFPVDAAIGESRRAIFGQGNDIEWGTPVVYLRGDGRLFDLREASSETVPAAAAAVATEIDEPPVEPASAETEPETDLEDAAVVASATAVVEAEEEPTEAVEAAGAVAEPEEPIEPPATAPAPAGATPDSPSWFKQALFAIPMWLLWALIGIGAVIVVVLAISVFGGDGTTVTTADGGVVTTAAQEPEGTTAPPTTAPALFAEDGAAVAYQTSEPKNIDGRDDDWPQYGFHSIHYRIYTHPAVLDGDVARGGDDNESVIMLAWDQTDLYVFAEVRDNVHSAPNTGADIFRDDSINLNIIPGGQRSEVPDEDDHGLTLSPGERDGGTGEESAHYIVAGRTLGLGYAEVAAVYLDDGYTLEARVPWAEIGVVAPQPGDEFGLLLTVNDNDGEFLEKFLQAAITANMPGDGDLDNTFFRSPRLWGTLILKEAP